MSGALDNDGCIYYLPFRSRGRILRLDPNDGDSLLLVAETIGRGFKVAVLGNDGCIYGISYNRIAKFSPIDHSVLYDGSEFEEDYYWIGAVLAEDENIYSANKKEKILAIDTVNGYWRIIGNRVYKGSFSGWGCPVLGADKCIYFPPFAHDRVLKFNPSTQNILLIGESYGEMSCKWQSAVLV